MHDSDDTEGSNHIIELAQNVQAASGHASFTGPLHYMLIQCNPSRSRHYQADMHKTGSRQDTCVCAAAGNIVMLPPTSIMMTAREMVRRVTPPMKAPAPMRAKAPGSTQAHGLGGRNTPGGALHARNISLDTYLKRFKTTSV